MNPQTKAFTLSFGFHSLMALLALWAMGFTRPAVPPSETPLKTMMLLSLEAYDSPASPGVSAPAPRQAAPMPPKPAFSEKTLNPPTPLQSASPKPIPAQPSAVLPATATLQTPSEPVVQPSVSQATTPAPAIAAATAPKPEIPKTDLTAEKKHFYAALRSTIQNHLRYPVVARRRGMEGTVGVRFILNADGSVQNITLKEGPDVFHDAARMAVASASGIRIPDHLIAVFPSEIDLTLEFHLD